MAATMHCAPKRPGSCIEQRGVLHARGVDAYLVGTGVEQRPDVVDRVDAPAHRQRDEHLIGDRCDHLVQKTARFDARTDIEERELVGSPARRSGARPRQDRRRRAG
jgi:hypothetical protein